jgi:hypothetical protein
MKAHPMNAADTIKNKVTRGLVLDIKGNWIPMASLQAIEHNVLMHLEDGEVLYEGKWTKIKNLQTANFLTPGSGRPLAPKTDHINVSTNEAEHSTNTNAMPWKVISLSTGEQHSANENMIPLIRDISLEDVPDDSSGSWENASKSQMKIMALVASAIILLSLAVFIGIRLVF